MRTCRGLINEEVRGGGEWGEKMRLVKLGQSSVMTIKIFIIVEFYFCGTKKIDRKTAC